MRIQHNIMSMNAYRNYTNNVSSMQKNLERLSSGYKINRAGDDAAGLAISEKMRAQITGLQTAQKNAKDGISLVQTAEGALTEVHDMLNRMVELATMSANGTYHSDTDRSQLQKEMDELYDEIDRISKSANFNGITLLDGSMNADGADAIRAAAQKDANAILAAAQDKYNELISGVQSSKIIKGSAMMLDADIGAGDDPTKVVGTKNIYQILEESGSSDPGFTVNMENISFTFSNTSDSASGLTLTVNGQNITLKQKDLADAAKALAGELTAVSDEDDVDEGLTLKGADLAAVIAKAIQNGKGGTSVGTNGIFSDNTDADAANTFEVSADGTKLVFKATSKLPANFNVNLSITCDMDVSAGEVKAAANKWTSSAISVSAGSAGVNMSSNTGLTLKVDWDNADGQAATASAITASVDLSEIFEDWASTSNNLDLSNAGNVQKILKALVDDFNTKANGQFTATVSTNGQITFETAADGETGKSQMIVTKITLGGNASDATGGTANRFWIDTADEGTPSLGHNAYTPGMSGYSNAGNQDITEVTSGVKGQLASTSLELSKIKTEGVSDIAALDGAKITLGDTTYVINLTKEKDDAGNEVITGGTISVASGTANTASTFKIDTSEGAQLDDNLKAVFRALSRVANNNETFHVGVNTAGNITLTQRDTTAAKAKHMTKKSELSDYINISLADPEKLAKTKDEADKVLEDAQDKADAITEAAEKQAESAHSLSLQIGDTSDDYNKLEVSIKACNVDSMGELDDDGNVIEGRTLRDIRIDSQADAQDALDVIKGAINYVSDVRGTLGATQNRLDHTINNLSVMTENIQDAESTIRDTDIAEEMMSYTKNNILIQAAQAMLAQANQVPQGVLQLLQ